MYKIISLWMLINIAGFCSGQDVSLLKNQNGFHNFKFGSKPESYDNIAYTSNIVEDKIYLYIGQIQKAFGYNCSEIELSFSKRGLYRIEVYLEEKGEEVYKTLKKKLTAIYGKSYPLVILISDEKYVDTWKYEINDAGKKETYFLHLALYNNNQVELLYGSY